MTIKRYTKDIIIQKNFLTPEECKNVIKVLELQNKREKLSWTPISFYESYSSNLPQDNDAELLECNLSPTFFSDLQNKIIELTAMVNDKDPKQMSKIGYHTQKWEPGAYATIHADNSDNEGNASPFERSRYATFVYLNEDFEGGILNFPQHDIQIKPQIGLAAAFAGNYTNLHEVTMITSGVRYTLGSFWDDREESAYPEETRIKWKEELEQIREQQRVDQQEWQDLLKEGYKIDKSGNKYQYNKNIGDNK